MLMARGSVFRKDGAWAFRVDAGFHADTGKRRQLLRQGFATKRAAQEALAEAVGASTRGMMASHETASTDGRLGRKGSSGRRKPVDLGELPAQCVVLPLRAKAVQACH